MLYPTKKTLISISFICALTLLISAPFFVPKAEAKNIIKESIGSLVKKAIPGDVEKTIISAAGQCLTGIAASLVASKAKSLVDIAGNVPTSGANDITTIMGTTLKTYCLDVIGIQLAKNALKKFTTSTVKWIQTGYKGGPLYVKDPGAFFSSIADDEIVDLSIAYRGSRSPFGNDIARSIISSYKQTLDASVKYNLDTIADEATIEKYNVNFSAGGWDTWLVQTQLPQNNPIGATFQASDHITKNISSSLKSKPAQVQEEINQGMGFLGIKKCVAPKGYESPPKGWSKTAANAVVNNKNSSIDEVATALSDLNQYVCTKWETTTPGNVIASKLNLSLGTSERQAELADQLNESVAAIFDSLASSLLNKGLDELDGEEATVDVEGNGGYGSNTTFSDTTTSTGGGGQWYNTSGVDVNLWHDIVPQIEIENTYIETLTIQKGIISNQLIPKLYELDYCVPGPRPDWREDAKTIVDSAKESNLGGLSATRFLYDNLDLSLPLGYIQLNDGVMSKELDEALRVYTLNIQDAWFSNTALLYLPTINAINIQEYKTIQEAQEKLDSITDELVLAKSNINKLTYIKDQVSLIQEPPESALVTQEQKDSINQLLNVYAQIQKDLTTTSIINDEKRINDNYLAKVSLIGNPSSGYLKECIKEVAQISTDKRLRFSYPEDLLPRSIQSSYLSQLPSYSTTEMANYYGPFGSVSIKSERVGPTYATPTLYYGIDGSYQQSCPVYGSTGDTFIHISLELTIKTCPNSAAFENFIHVY